MSTIISGSSFGYEHDIKKFYISCAIHAVTGTIAGILVNKVSDWTAKAFNMIRLFDILFQMLLIVTFLYLMEKGANKFTKEFQINTPGLIFVGMFFGTQSNLFNNIGQLI